MDAATRLMLERMMEFDRARDARQAAEPPATADEIRHSLAKAERAYDEERRLRPDSFDDGGPGSDVAEDFPEH